MHEQTESAFGAYQPLLLRAALAGQMGQTETCSGVRMIDGMFVYLDGLPDGAALAALTGRWQDRLFVPLRAPEAWERALCGLGRPVGRTQRYQMQEMLPAQAAQTLPSPVPEGYELRPFDAEAFARRPFGHGHWYRDAAHFAAEGTGAVVWKDGEIVASASSYLTFEGHVELDVSTLDTHRRLGLAWACCAEMLRQCGDRGLTVHWDAQHEVSRHLAETLGFELLTPYAAYSFMDAE